jgi:hypothetical protein
MERLGEFLEAMADNVTGIRHLMMMRDPNTGKFERITGSAAQIDKALKMYFVFEPVGTLCVLVTDC